MKHKLSISIDSSILEEIDKITKQPGFRNKSHFFEMAILEHLKEVSQDG